MSATSILHVTNFETELGLKVAVRMRYNQWEWWDGNSWNAVAGAVSGLDGHRLYSTAFKGKLIAANGHSRLLSWDGVGSVGILSAEAPKAHFVTRIGNRLFVARFPFAGSFDDNPDVVAWSAEDNILEWTDALAGAGTAVLVPEGAGQGSNHISGVSTIERGVLIYRERSLVLGSKTGVRAAPFRFATIDQAHGTRSPYSIANGGLAFGDFFLGFDYIVYHFDGQSPPTPVGLPIQPGLEDSITDLEHCVGYINPLTMEYHLLIPTEAAPVPILSAAYVFSIKDYIRKQKLQWRYRRLTDIISGDKVTVGNYVQKTPTEDTLVVDDYDDPVHDIVDDQDQLVDSLVQKTKDLTLIGTDLGHVYKVDETKFVQDGFWLSKRFGQAHKLITIDRIRVVASSDDVSYVGVSITWDGGQTFSNEITVRIEKSRKGSFSGGGWEITTGHMFQVYVRMISGNPIVHELDIIAQPRGRVG